MLSNRSTVSLIGSVCAAVLACTEPAGAPLPLLTDVEGTPGQLLASGGKAGGRADVHGTPVQNVLDETYSFTAVSTDAPFAQGQVEVHILRFTGQEVVVHAEVTCVSIVGNEAWVGSRVRQFLVNRQHVLEAFDRPMIFRVRDLGEAEGTLDLASLVFFPPPGEGDLEHCNNRPDFPILRESSAGSIQVKP